MSPHVMYNVFDNLVLFTTIHRKKWTFGKDADENFIKFMLMHV